jgi:hypothetical protein
MSQALAESGVPGALYTAEYQDFPTVVGHYANAAVSVTPLGGA